MKHALPTASMLVSTFPTALSAMLWTTAQPGPDDSGVLAGLPRAAAARAVAGTPHAIGTRGQFAAGTRGDVVGQDAGPLPDRLIADAVEDDLEADARIDVNWIEVDCIDGVVGLRGRVDDLLSKRRAARIARTIRGVVSVENRIIVVPQDIAGSDLAADVRTALQLNAATEAFDLDVAADDSGQVVLTGDLASSAERRLAERVAASVAGVTDVVDQMTLDLAQSRSDEEIRRDIEQLLAWSVRIDDRDLHATVDQGHVTIRGTVGSAAQRKYVEDMAWVVGVHDLDVSDVRVVDLGGRSSYAPSDRPSGPGRSVRSGPRWPEGGRDDGRPDTADDDERPADEHAPGDLEPWSDERIAGAAARILQYDPLVDADGITIDADGTELTLRGSAPDLQTRHAAEAAVADVVGVTTVRNRLRVRPRGNLTDAQIAARVGRAMTLSPWIDPGEILVSVDGGTVTLRGDVDDAFTRSHTTSTAAAVSGVTRVINRTDTESLSGAFLYDPWVDWWPSESMIMHSAATPVLDSEYERRLEADVERQLWWSPFVDAGQVQVGVEGDRVTLSGVVDSDSEREAAIENAYEGGAAVVVDRLLVGEEDAAEDG